MNLCTNAWHALAGQTGRVEATLDRLRIGPGPHPHPHPHPHPRLSHLPAGLYAQLQVADNGAGLGEATQARVVEPFFTPKPVGQLLGRAGYRVTSLAGVTAALAALEAQAQAQAPPPATRDHRCRATALPGRPGSARSAPCGAPATAAAESEHGRTVWLGISSDCTLLVRASAAAARVIGRQAPSGCRPRHGMASANPAVI